MMEQEIETMSTCIMLVPDATYAKHRPDTEDAHLTVAYFGNYPHGAYEVAALNKAVHSIAKQIGKPIEAHANAVGLFPDRDRFAVVDLIDGIGTFYARRHVENIFGPHGVAPGYPTIDYTHGFTPHVTREYLSADAITAEMVLPTSPFEFTFEAIGLWHGQNHYEVAL